ncbi:Y-family DNA polymerase [Sphingomonas sp. CCH10-B3]|uniref:Y-family DNA polymerase n=1 Tax=Sphingomonas sp. CCH10-B3 TaxID=1768757 RepID=UPI00082C544C|nr:DNA polymerase Y family protein [Sphingomonas sp. CCH10-B3]
MTRRFSETRRFLALYWPHLAADRWRRTNGAADSPPNALLVFTAKQRGAMRIVATCERGRGLAGLTLADARAREPDLVVIDADPAGDLHLFERIADGCDRYTPMVALDSDTGVTLDVTGCGDAEAIADDVATRLAAAGWQVRHALAGTPEAAQALARYQTAPAADEAAAVRRLPIAALEADDDTELALRRAGLKTIGDLAARPSAPLVARFGADVGDRLARLLGPLEMLGELAAEAEVALAERHMGGRRYAARLYRSDGVARDLSVEASLPMRGAKDVMRLFGERLDALADPIDPGFGFDLIRLAVPLLEPMAPTQLQLEGGAVAEGELAALIDRLSARAGKGKFRRLRPRDSHIPEQAVLALPAIDAPQAIDWDAPEAGEPPSRPIHLFDPPQMIDVIAEVPDGPPHRFRWRRGVHEVTRFEGPERIAAQWWKRDDNAGLTRDYYRVEDARGRRFWIFRHGLYGAERVAPGWYMHGLFA